MKRFQVGDQAPDITLPSLRDRVCRLSEMRGQRVVVFFYPKNNTPGCTAETIDFTGTLDEFTALNTVVWGVSKNSVQQHKNFSAKYNLGVELLSDQGGDVCERYDVWVEKQMFGKAYMGIERTTILIDEVGKVAHIWPKVKVGGHVEEVLSAVKALPPIS